MPNATLHSLLDQFAAHDENDDGDPAIVRLELMPFEPTNAAPVGASPLVLVIVEARLTRPLPGGEDLVASLLQFRNDLWAEGFEAYAIVADLYQGPRHQDGRTLLALRRFLQAVRATFAHFTGVILVGAFPEAMLVRRCIWRPAQLSVGAENIAARSEIVLADLTGQWDTLYHEEPTPVEVINATPDAATAATPDWPVDGAIFTAATFTRSLPEYRDFFLIDDADYDDISPSSTALQLRIRRQLRHPELAPSDRDAPNPLARPDILVSRINARNIAVNPVGARPQDEQGRPQAFIPVVDYDWPSLYSQDPLLERRILIDYFRRNHRFRVGAFSHLPLRVASISGTLDFSAAQGAAYLAAAGRNLEPPLVAENASLLEYIAWFRESAVLRCIRAHSSSLNTTFRPGTSAPALAAAAGGHPFRWRLVDGTYVPSFEGHDPYADLSLHRTIWNNGILEASGASHVIHAGCEVNTPAGTDTMKYYDPGYAPWQNGESVLFYMNGLCLLARAKVYYDLPTQFADALSAQNRARFGDGWSRFYAADAADGTLGRFDHAIESKKAYFWSMLGDWTTRLNYRGGLGLIGITPSLRTVHVQADESMIDAWNFVGRDTTVQAVGDMDGDGADEVVVTSPWGLGVLDHDEDRWRARVLVANNSRVGAWHFNAGDNANADRIHGIARFTGRRREELLVSSSRGIGLLRLVGARMEAEATLSSTAPPGGWSFDAGTDEVQGFGDLDGDGRAEIVVKSPDALRVLAASGAGLAPIETFENGTRLGDWLWSSDNDAIVAVGDFDGDGRSDLAVTSRWGLGVLSLHDLRLTSVAMQANASDVDGYVLDTGAHRVVGAGDVNGDGRAELLIACPSGLYALGVRDKRLYLAAVLHQGERAGGWVLDTASNQFGPMGEFNDDGRQSLVVRSPWGIAVLGVHGTTFRCVDLQAYGAVLGDWILRPTDRIAGAGRIHAAVDRDELMLLGGA